MHPKNKKPINSYKPAGMDVLLRQLRDLIISARQKVVFTVNTLQVQTYWEVGRHIIEFEQNGAHRANYGTKLLDRLAEKLTQEFGKGFDISNLRNMRLFFKAFPIRDALRHELSWTHYRTLLHLDDVQARQWYMTEAATQNWSSRALERQIGTLYYERLLASKDRKALRQEANKNILPLKKSPRDFVRDPVMLEFLGLPETGRLLESTLEKTLIRHLQTFLLELGKGFAFVARQQRISTETKTHRGRCIFLILGSLRGFSAIPPRVRPPEPPRDTPLSVSSRSHGTIPPRFFSTASPTDS
jgi:predicted nuclease of restriction endonuclease-like (RecB) superfamily